MIEVLLVDDETYVTQSLAVTIPWSEFGVEGIKQASSAFEAIRILEEHAIDIVVTDIRMPEMSGLELIDHISRRWPNVRTLLLTGYSEFEYAKKAIQLQAFDYLLKPVNDEEFIVAISGAIESLRHEWREADKFHQLIYDRKSDFSVLRANLMVDLVLGRTLSARAIQEKLNLYEIPIHMDRPAVMMLVRLGKSFVDMDHHSRHLLEYAIGNIAEESFSDHFLVWHSKSPHDFMVVIIQFKNDVLRSIEMTSHFETSSKHMLEEATEAFRHNVNNYLKGNIHGLVTGWFQFPSDITSAYRSGLGEMYHGAREQVRAIHFLEDRSTIMARSPAKLLDSLYKPPSLTYLLESHQWDSVRQKLKEVFDDIDGSGISQEHLYEVYLSITNAFLYIVHKQGQYISQFDQNGIEMFLNQSLANSPEKLMNWSLGILNRLQSELSASDRNTKSFIVKKVQELISNDLGNDISVKTIADKVFLHPVYLSKVFKTETGEALGDCIIRLKMERALYLLKNSNMKIYEITSELGYQNPQYFSKMFRKHFGLAPNEFREQ